MAYFPNGMAAEAYKEQYCYRCVHCDGEYCPVLDIHELHNYDQVKDPILRGILDTLIPSKGATNEQCAMFVERVK